MQISLEPIFAGLGVTTYLLYRFLRTQVNKSDETKSTDKDAHFEDKLLRASNESLEPTCSQVSDSESSLPEPDSEPDELPSPREQQAPKSSDSLVTATKDTSCSLASIQTNTESSSKSSKSISWNQQSRAIALACVAIFLSYALQQSADSPSLSDNAGTKVEAALDNLGELPLEARQLMELVSERKLMNEPLTTSKVLSVKLDKQRTHLFSEGETDYFRSAYFGTVQVGIPAQSFTVVFDTGSGHLVLPSMYCHSDTCAAHKRYRRSGSTTARDIDYDGRPVAAGSPRDQITVSYGTGEVTGVFIEDLVCMRGEDIQEEQIFEDVPAGSASLQHERSRLARLESPEEEPALATNESDVSLEDDKLPHGCMRLRFVAATSMSDDPFRTFQFDGVLGLGLEGLSQTPAFNFLQTIAQSVDDWGGVSQPHTFAVFLADNYYEESQITVGGWSRHHLREEVSWNSVWRPDMGHWIVNIKRIRVGNEILKFCEEGCKAVMDTGTSLLSVPSVVFPELYESLKHRASLDGECPSHGPSLHVELENYTVTIGPPEYSRAERRPYVKPRPRFANNKSSVPVDTRADVLCKPTLMTLDLPDPLGPKLFILGEPILRKYYTVYDSLNKRIGVGRAWHRRTARYNFHPEDGGEDSKATPPRVTMFDAFRSHKGLF